MSGILGRIVSGLVEKDSEWAVAPNRPCVSGLVEEAREWDCAPNRFWAC